MSGCCSDAFSYIGRIALIEMKGRACTAKSGSCKDTMTLNDITSHEGTFIDLNLPCPSTHPINPDKYAPELFYTPAETDKIQALNKSFSNLQNLYFDHYKNRKKGRRRSSVTNRAIPMHLEYDETVWKLFVGRVFRTITYTDIDALLLNNTKPDQLLDDMKADRMRWHAELVSQETPLHVMVDDVEWRITRDHGVPWMIPVQYSWCNSMAVDPMTATLSEMFECNRIQTTNHTLFDADALYKHLLPHLTYMEKHVMFDEDRAQTGTACSLAFNWFGPHYVLCKRCFDVLVLHDELVEWSMLLKFKRTLVDSNRTRIIVPKDTVIASLDGEVRPLDMFSADAYALQLMNKCEAHWFEASDDVSYSPLKEHVVTFLVNTLVKSDDRPAVAGSGFFANTTCMDVGDVWFGCTPHWVDDKRTGTAILNSQNSYRHGMITASHHITGDMIISRHWTGVSGMDEYYLLPVEWHYGRRADEAGMEATVCNCMSRCNKLPIKQKGVVQLFNNKIERREFAWDASAVDAVRGLKSGKKEGIKRYLEFYETTSHNVD